MVRIILDIDEKLIEDLVRATDQKSDSKAVNKALEEYLRNTRIESLINLEGKLDLNLDDWYEVRHMER